MSIAKKKNWQDPKYVKKILGKLLQRPTSYEQKIIDLCSKYNLPFRYIGNGAKIVGYVNPDFEDTLNSGLYIEPHHSWNKEDEEKYRNNRYKKLCVDQNKVLCLFDDDMNRKDWEPYCLDKIKFFLLQNNVRILNPK